MSEQGALHHQYGFARNQRGVDQAASVLRGIRGRGRPPEAALASRPRAPVKLQSLGRLRRCPALVGGEDEVSLSPKCGYSLAIRKSFAPRVKRGEKEGLSKRGHLAFLSEFLTLLGCQRAPPPGKRHGLCIEAISYRPIGHASRARECDGLRHGPAMPADLRGSPWPWLRRALPWFADQMTSRSH